MRSLLRTAIGLRMFGTSGRNGAALLVLLGVSGMVFATCAIEIQTEVSDPLVASSSMSLQDIQQRVSDLTVLIETPHGSGSGLLFYDERNDRVIALTNRHVVGTQDTVQVCWAVLQECIKQRVSFRGSDYFDVATVDIPGDSDFSQQMRIWNRDGSLDAVRFGGRWSKGDVVFASGYPGGNRGGVSISTPVVTEGIISQEGIATYGGAHYIEHGADVEPGSSGGPLINSSGTVVGIISGTNLFAERLELAIPMDAIVEWMRTGVEPNLTVLPRVLPSATPVPSPTPTPERVPPTATPEATPTSGPAPSPNPTATPTATPSPTATPTPTPAPRLGTRENPIPLQTVVEFGDWEITVTGFVPDAFELIAAADIYGLHEKPPPGQQYVFVEVMGTYKGSAFGKMSTDFGFYVVGDTNRIYDRGFVFEVNTLRDQPSVLSEGSVEGYVPFVVPSEEIDSLLLLVVQGSQGIHTLDFATATGYFAVR